MRKFAFAALAAGIIGVAAPAIAQSPSVRIDERGVTVRTDRDNDHDRWREHRRHDRFVERRRWRDRDIDRTGSLGCRTDANSACVGPS